MLPMWSTMLPTLETSNINIQEILPMWAKGTAHVGDIQNNDSRDAAHMGKKMLPMVANDVAHVSRRHCQHGQNLLPTLARPKDK